MVSSTGDKSLVANGTITSQNVGSKLSHSPHSQIPAVNTPSINSNGAVVMPAHCPDIKRFYFCSIDTVCTVCRLQYRIFFTDLDRKTVR